MLDQILLASAFPFRRGAVAWPRGSLPRKGCIAALKFLSRRIAIADRIHEVVPLDMPDISFEPTDSMVMEAVYWFGVQGYEGKLADVWVQFCGRSKNILEVGGNIGLFTVIGARNTSGRYTVLEPLPQNVAILTANLKRNRIDRVEVMQAAAIAGNEAISVHLNVPAEGRVAPVGAHIQGAGEVANRSSGSVIEVTGEPFVDLVKGRDLVKIDAEGIEVDLLASARPQIAAGKPTLVVEILPESVRLAALIADLARELDYKIFVVPAYGSDRIERVEPAMFTAALPAQHKSKDIVLSDTDISSW